MKLVLDEMWSPAIATELRRRGCDVVAAKEAAQSHYQHLTDTEFFHLAQAEGRIVLTDNIKDFEPIVRGYELRGEVYAGVIYTTRSQFDRSDPRIIGLMVRALEQLLASSAEDQLSNRRHFLQRLRPRTRGGGR